MAVYNDGSSAAGVARQDTLNARPLNSADSKAQDAFESRLVLMSSDIVSGSHSKPHFAEQIERTMLNLRDNDQLPSVLESVIAVQQQFRAQNVQDLADIIHAVPEDQKLW